MGKKTPAPPPAPDPYATAQAQTQSNRDTAVANAYLNRINQVTPYGNLTYSVDGNNPDGTPRFTQTMTLDPRQQRVLDSQLDQQGQIDGIAGGYMGRIQDMMGQGFDTSGLPGLNGSVNGMGVQTGFDGGGPLQSQIGDAGRVSPFNLNPSALQTNVGDAGPMQRSLDYSGAPRLPGADDFSADRQRVTAAMLSRINPELDRQQGDLENRLTNQGIMRGTEAWNREIDAFGRQRNDALMQADLAGGQEQSRLFGLGLAARQQGVGEANTQGQFANNAQGQAYAQALSNAQFGNNARMAGFDQALAGNQAANAAQAQQFGQNLTAAQFGNQTQQQGFDQAQQRAAFANSAAGQDLQRQLLAAQFGNQARQQALQEASFLRNVPLNEFNALRSASQIQGPQFNGYAQTQQQATPIGDYIMQKYQGDMNAYNAQLASQNSLLGGLFGLGGSLLGAGGAAKGFGNLFSDRRLKTNIERVATTPGGTPVYRYEYIFEPGVVHTGVMADEVPHAAVEGPGGFLMVDYTKVL